MKKVNTVLLTLFAILAVMTGLLFISHQWSGRVEKPNKKPISSILLSVLSENEPDFPSLSIENIFRTDRSPTSSLPKEKVVTLLTTGDVMPGRSVNTNSRKIENFNWPYEKVGGELREADVTFINLESPIIKNCLDSDSGFKFCADEKSAKALADVGVDVVGLANNHAGNYGKVGFDETIYLLSQSGIPVAPTIETIKGIRFAFLAYNDIDAGSSFVLKAEKESIKRDIELVKPKSDVVVVAFHWGTEYTHKPNQRQIDLGRFTIDSGATLVIGNHPHWIQPVEVYKGGIIVYSHGNFVFDQDWSLKTKQGMVGKYYFYNKKLVDAEFLPVFIEKLGQPRFLEGEEKDKTIESFLLFGKQ